MQPAPFIIAALSSRYWRWQAYKTLGLFRTNLLTEGPSNSIARGKRDFESNKYVNTLRTVLHIFYHQKLFALEGRFT